MDFLNLNDSVKSCVQIAKGFAREYGNGVYYPAHLLKALLHKDIGLKGFITSLGKDIGYLEEWAEVRIDDLPKGKADGEVDAHESIAAVFEEADNVRLKWGLLEINPVCVLTALARPGIGFTIDELKSFPLREQEIHDSVIADKDVNASFATNDQDEGSFGGSTMTSLLKYCIDRNADIQKRGVAPVVERDSEIRMMMEILGRHSRPNVLITGDSGVGKTALVEGLISGIVEEKAPSFLLGATVYELDTGALVAGATYKGEIEDRLKGIIKDIRQLDKAILFIDDIHVLLDPKQGNSGAAGILKPELSRGDLTIIGTTSVDEYRKIVEPDQAFSRRFEVLELDEPDLDTASRMVDAVLRRYEEFHKIKVDGDSISECVRLAQRYVKDRKLPDAAIDLLDRTMSAVKMINETAEGNIKNLLEQIEFVENNKKKQPAQKLSELRLINASMQNLLGPVLMGELTGNQDSNDLDSYVEWLDYLKQSLTKLQNYAGNEVEEITVHEIAAVISSKTGIPIGKIQAGEKERLLNMEDILRRRVVGQDSALKSLVDAILESRSGMNRAGQPIGSFFLLGPTGTGKTELAKALAEALFNDEKAMIRFDMSEFKEEHSAALLYGAPPGYVGYEEGGMLVNKIRQQPYSVVLFDEIEKAHASVYDIFLQIMDEGKLHDRLGKEGDFSNAIVLFTSNVGSQWLMEQKDAGHHPTTTQLMEVMGQYFRPEFLGRLSEILPFSPITDDILLKIFDIQFKSITDTLEDKGIGIVLSDEAREMLAHKGFTPKYGARQVNGVIRNFIRRPVSRKLISGSLKKGDTLEVNLDKDEELVWSVS
jgi:ATP-dependent Clp protease ATP-binding subunit ClpA